VVVSTQHSEKVSNTDLRDAITEHVIKPIIPASMLDAKTKYHINPTGRFVIGGPMGDAGLTGRKIIVDTYGGYSRHGAAHSPARILLRWIVGLLHGSLHREEHRAAGLARKTESNWPTPSESPSLFPSWRKTFGTAAIPEEKITALIREYFTLTPKAIIETLDLRRPIYKATAAYGHFGRSGPGFTWERTDRADALRKAAGLGAAATAEVGARA